MRSARPRFTTIAVFIARVSIETAGVFRYVLTVCYTEGLVGRTMFAIDGCKISSNCATEWSRCVPTGTRRRERTGIGDQSRAGQQIGQGRPYHRWLARDAWASNSEASVKAVLDTGIDAYIAGNQFHKRDPDLADQQTHKKKTTDKRRTSRAQKYFVAADFVFDGAGILRSRCLRNPHSPIRWITKLDAARSYTVRMIDRFDSPRRRYWYRRCPTS